MVRDDANNDGRSARREYFLCSEDQWDIYKLDPAYECFVPASPDHPTVVRKDPSFEDMSIHNSNRGSTIHTNSKKRRGFSPVVEEDTNAGPAKKSRIVQEGRVIEAEDDASSDEEDDEDGDDDDDSNIDMLATAREIDPERVRLMELKYDADTAERLAEEIPAGSSAATAGGGSGRKGKGEGGAEKVSRNDVLRRMEEDRERVSGAEYRGSCTCAEFVALNSSS